jgi:hypothetical protein
MPVILMGVFAVMHKHVVRLQLLYNLFDFGDDIFAKRQPGILETRPEDILHSQYFTGTSLLPLPHGRRAAPVAGGKNKHIHPVPAAGKPVQRSSATEFYVVGMRPDREYGFFPVSRRHHDRSSRLLLSVFIEAVSLPFAGNGHSLLL